MVYIQLCGYPINTHGGRQQRLALLKWGLFQISNNDTDTNGRVCGGLIHLHGKCSERKRKQRAKPNKIPPGLVTSPARPRYADQLVGCDRHLTAA